MYALSTLVQLLMVLLLMVLPAAGAHAQSDCDAEAHLEGTLEFRDDAWPLRLHTIRDGDTLRFRLDIPQLVMAGRSVDAECDGSAMVLDLPFGFGRLPLRLQSGVWLGARLIGRDSLVVRFAAGAPPPYRVESVHIRRPDGALAANLYLPAGVSRPAAIVLVHGSGPQGRHSLFYRSWADFYARRGVATLIYDKRGVGESAGDFGADSAFHGLTEDALAASAFLRSRTDIDSSRVGMGGHSQAGWIAYRAAARDPAIAFLALLSVPAVSVAEQEIQRVRAGMQRAGLSESEIHAAVAHTRLLFAVAVGGLGWEGLAESSARAAATPWAEWVHRPASIENLRWWRTHATVDPADDLRRIHVPVFAAFSAADPVVPAAYNAGKLGALLATDSSHVTIITVPRGDHLLEVSGRDASGRWRLPRTHPDVMRALDAWIRKR